jgi:hydroxypyruvate reductase 1
VYSNYAVGYNNVDIKAASRHGIAVGNTPGVLTETTAEMAVALTFAAARRTGEAERFVRGGRFAGWLPSMFLGKLLWRKTLGVVGAGRIGSAYAKMMVEGHKMNLSYCSRSVNEELESRIAAYGKFLESIGEKPVSCTRADSIDELLGKADCVSLHTVLDDSTRHMIDSRRLSLMKKNAILVNTSRGPVIDEAALVEHLKANPGFRAGLDVFEEEPSLQPGLAELENVVIVPHIGSATGWTRKGMAVLAARNVAAVLNGYPAWNRPDISGFLSESPEKAAPSIVNAQEAGIPVFDD